MLEHLALSESGFLFDARTGSTYSLNRTGTFILRELIAGTAAGKLAERLNETFEVDAETAARDVEQLLFRLKFLGVIPEEGAN
jgi:PqqD family protein of HPr-rel-A system